MPVTMIFPIIFLFSHIAPAMAPYGPPAAAPLAILETAFPAFTALCTALATEAPFQGPQMLHFFDLRPFTVCPFCVERAATF